MVRTTIYLPEELKGAVERRARHEGVSEAEIIRRAIKALVAAPEPHAGFLSGAAIAERLDEELTGFGDR